MADGALLVASDGSDAALGALHVARRLELRDGRRIRVVSVLEPVSVFDTGFGAALPEHEIEESRREALRSRVVAQVREVRASESAWEVSVVDGIPAERIAGRARETGADAIVVGLGRHGLLDRFLGTETALRVVQLADRPVLAVPPDLRELGHRLVAAVDFSTFSERAVRAALPFLKPPGEVHLLHVLSGLESLPVQEDGWRQQYRDEVEGRLDRLGRHLSLPDGWSCRTVVLTGIPGEEISAYAREVSADLVASGSHGHSFVGRLVLGSVSTGLLRTAEQSILVVPPEASVPAPEEIEITEEERAWARALRDFSERHRDEPTLLELDDPELGAQHSGRGFLLGGVEYDPRAKRILILLGRGEGIRDHLTHSLPGPRSVELVGSGEEGEEALRVELERGQVILRAGPRAAGSPGGG